jgi:hypothetical protein
MRLAGTATLKATLDQGNKTLLLEAKALYNPSKTAETTSPGQPILSFTIAAADTDTAQNFEFFEKIELQRP